jgi:uncharacterized membrane protein HdeD (DUF308 family)
MADLSGNVVPPPQGGGVAPAVPPADVRGAEPGVVPSAAAEPGGMRRFAVLVLGLTGIWQVVAGLVALTEPGTFRTPARALALHVSYTTWGWVHLVIGILAVVAAFGILAGNRLAAVVGVVLAVISAVVNLVFLRADPGAAILVIVLDVLVIWGITAQAPPPRPSP